MSLKTVAPRRRWEGAAGLKLKAFGDRIIVRTDEEGIDEHAFGEGVKLEKKGDEVRTAGGIVIPDNQKELAIRAALTGTVLHVGDAVTWVKVGDEILFGQYAGTTIDAIGGYENTRIMAEDDVLCLILASAAPARRLANAAS